MGDETLDTLNHAIARNCAVVLSLPSAGLLRHHKSRFLQLEPIGIWMAMGEIDRPLVDALIGSGAPVGVSFKTSEQRVTFAASLLQYRPDYALNSAVTMPAALISTPKSVKAVQRRSHYRVRVLSDAGVRARVWRMPSRALLRDRPQPSQEVLAEVRDLSLGGVGVTLRGRDDQPPKISTADRLRIEILQGEFSILVEGRMRNATGPQAPNAITTGIQFKELSGSLEERQNMHQLARLIGGLQREEIRRSRLAARPAG